MALGFAVYASPHALWIVPAFAIAALFAGRAIAGASRAERAQAALVRMVVISFPPVAAVVSWCCVSLVFTGNAFSLFRDRAIPSLSSLSTDALSLGNLRSLLLATWYDLARSPLYGIVGVAMLFYAPRRLPAYAIPLIVITVSRALGVHWPEVLAWGLYAVTALILLPSGLRRCWEPVLVLVALLQVLVANSWSPQSADLDRWQQILRSGQPVALDRVEEAVARCLYSAPHKSVLTDEEYAYRYIARTGTARPFVLPGDAIFDLAVSAPAEHVRYILLPTTRDNLGGSSLGHFLDVPPQGFVLEAKWSGWRVYRHEQVRPLLESIRSGDDDHRPALQASGVADALAHRVGAALFDACGQSG